MQQVPIEGEKASANKLYIENTNGSTSYFFSNNNLELFSLMVALILISTCVDEKMPKENTSKKFE